ncbi:MAG: isochorismatase family protein, partial [Acidimicrobiales bacterium]
SEHRVRTSMAIDPRRAAVLVVDMLNDLLDEAGAMPLLGARALCGPINRLLAGARARSMPVIWICDEHGPGDQELQKCSVHCIRGTWGARIVDELERVDDERRVAKRRYSGFYATDLDLQLRELGVKHVILVGVVTNICVRSTAHDAFFAGYDVIVAERRRGGHQRPGAGVEPLRHRHPLRHGHRRGRGDRDDRTEPSVIGSGGPGPGRGPAGQVAGPQADRISHAVTIRAMSTSPSGLARLIEEHGARALRYCGVSVVNVTVGVSTLVFCHAVLGWSALQSNIASWVVSTAPAYLLSRAWVWRQSGTHRFSGEVIPFWVLALIGLVVSSVAVDVIGRHTDSTLFVLAGNLGAYGMVWMAKYLVLDKVMWRSAPAEAIEVA